jgi:hypothetical protein
MLKGRYGFRWMIAAWFAVVVTLALVIWAAMDLSSAWFGGSRPL